jgi:sulfate transport system ATP-binding protein
MQRARARLHSPLRVVIAEESAGEFESPVESLRRTPAGVSATIAINGYVQTLEIDLSIGRAAALGSHLPHSLSKARLVPRRAARQARANPASGT